MSDGVYVLCVDGVELNFKASCLYSNGFLVFGLSTGNQ